MEPAERKLLEMILNEVREIRLHLVQAGTSDNPAASTHISGAETQLIETIRRLSSQAQRRGEASGMVGEADIFAASSATEDETKAMLAKLSGTGHIMSTSPGQYVTLD